MTIPRSSVIGYIEGGSDGACNTVATLTTPVVGATKMAEEKVSTDASPVQLMTRAEAKAAGAKQYFTGKPCKHGHIAMRTTVNGCCVTCGGIRTSAHAKANRERNNTRQREKYKVSGPKTYERMKRRFLSFSPEEQQRHKDLRKVYRKKHYAENRAEYIERARLWKLANPEKRNANAKRYNERHPETRRGIDHRRRAKKLGVSQGDDAAILRFMRWLKTAKTVRCYWCSTVAPKKERHADHIIPLSKGGAHSAANLCAACATCNRSKSAKLPEVFAGQAELSFAA